MDVDSFIRAHEADWQRLQTLTARGHGPLAKRGGVGIEEAITLYHRVSSQLAEAQTRLRDPDLIAHLTGVVAQARTAVYGADPRSAKDVAALFGSRYRQAVAAVLPSAGVAAALLFGSLIVVTIWVALSGEARNGLVPGFAEALAGPEIQELRESDPAVGGMIFINNVRVAVIAFALGVTVGIGTVAILLYNGLHVGAIAGAATAAGVSGRFYELVLPHGFLELFAICLAGGAGLYLGRAIIRPGDRDRAEALAEATKTSLIVIVGVVPAFLVAAVIEGLLTGVTGSAVFEIGLGLAVAAAYAAWLIVLGRSPASDGAESGGAMARPVTAAPLA